MAGVSYNSLGDAADRLREALILLDAHRADALHVSMRNSVLLSFQFAYGLCRPMIERFLVGEGDDPLEVQEMSYTSLVRSANRRGVLRADWTLWSTFREARNRMAHAKVRPSGRSNFSLRTTQFKSAGLMTHSVRPNLAGRLQISEREWVLVADILAAHIPDRKVWAFGSRATGLRVKRFSDLDLAVAGRLTWAEQAALHEAFDEALINFKVDVVEVDLLEEDFKQRIEKDFMLLQGASNAETQTA